MVRDLDRYIGRLGEDVRRLSFDIPEAAGGDGGSDAAAARSRLTDIMQHKVGVLRRAPELQEALDELSGLTSSLRFGRLGEAEYEVLNMLTLGTQIAKCALLREESRGVHLRDDFPELDDERWRKHITLRLPEHERRRASAGSGRHEQPPMQRAKLPAGGAHAPRAAPCARTSPATATSPGRSSPATASPGWSAARPACCPASPRSRRRRGWSIRRSTVTVLIGDGERFATGDGIAELRGPLAANPGRRAHGAQLPLPAERSGDADGHATSPRRPAPRPASPRRARPRPACAPSRSRPSCTAAARRTASASSTARMIKDNHVAAAGGVAAAVSLVRGGAAHLHALEVEVDTLEQLDEALACGATIVLLDNMDTATVRDAVARVAGRAVVEVSGGVRLERVRELAEAGVDVISVGALTTRAPWIDLALDLEV